MITPTISINRPFIKHAGRILCYIPTTADKIGSLFNAVTYQQPSNEIQKKFDEVYNEQLNQDPEGLSLFLWDEYHKCKSKQIRNTLKKQHNNLVEQLNKQYQRKSFLQIH